MPGLSDGNWECPICGSHFQPNASQRCNTRSGRQAECLCSLACLKKFQSGIRSGARNSRWRGGRAFDHGYARVRTDRPGKYPMEHRLVAEGMIGRPLMKGEVVHHINGDILDNRPDNLQVLSNSEHVLLHARFGESSANAKLTEQQVLEMRARRAAEGTGTAILAREYGVCEESIRNVLKGKTWKHVAQPARVVA